MKSHFSVIATLLFQCFLLAQKPATTTALSKASAENVECNCRKILEAAKLANDNPTMYTNGLQAYTAHYSPIPSGLFSGSGNNFDELKTKCCELFNVGNPPVPGVECPDNYEYGQPFSQASRQAITDQMGVNNQVNHLADMPCTPEEEVPCIKDLDTCGCNKLQTEFAAWMTHPVYNPNTGTGPVTFEVFLKITTGTTLSNATELRDKCEELFLKGVAKDKNGNAVRGYIPSNPSGWWSKSAQSNLKQEVQDNRTSKHMIIPAGWSCNSDCTPPPLPCTKVLGPCDMKNVFRSFIVAEWFKQISGNPRYTLMGMGTFSDIDEYLGTMLEWTDQYHSHLENNTNPVDPIDAARVDLMRLLYDKLLAYYLEHTCPGDRVSPVTLEFLLKKMLGCGSGTGNINSTCSSSITCSQFGALLEGLLSSHTWPGFSGSNYSQVGDYALEFEYWYYTYLERKAANTNTQADDDWVATVLNALNTQYNPCYPTTELQMKDFIKSSWDCRSLPRPPGTDPSPCPNCYAANTEWLEALQQFINDVNKKPDPDRLTDYSYYLKESGWNTNRQISSFYNSILYQTGTDEENLTWNLNEDYQGGNLMPGMRTLIKDNNGFRLDMSLDWPTEEPRWNFNYIQNFINIRPIKSKGCDKPKYFYVDVVYEVPSDYTGSGNPFNYSNNFPQLPFTPDRCYDTVTLIGKIWESTNGLGVGKEVPCLGSLQPSNDSKSSIAKFQSKPAETKAKTENQNEAMKTTVRQATEVQDSKNTYKQVGNCMPTYIAN